TMPDAKRYFRAPFGRAGPFAIMAFNVLLLYMWIHEVENAVYSLAMGIFFLLFGIPLYILIKLQTDEKFVEKFYDRISFFWDMLFSRWYSKREESKVVSRLGLSKKSVVLDFGCGSGFTTRAVSRRASKVVAVDISVKQLKRAVEKTKKAGLHNVVFVKAPQLSFPPGTFDAVSAVGVLEHLDYPHVPVRKLMKMLRRGGRFSFLVFGKSFIFPGPAFLNEKEIRRMFPPNVSADVRKERKLFTDYWYIWGTKN
ncbi:MAG: class I SAM-dependent methyltransferase, partial [Candidatus Aenigmarchaeota archaeon]|nr:class I SAM-dependent methyltransferase [Candidatus Aenigmarchaeota archaeon]